MNAPRDLQLGGRGLGSLASFTTLGRPYRAALLPPSRARWLLPQLGAFVCRPGEHTSKSAMLAMRSRCRAMALAPQVWMPRGRAMGSRHPRPSARRHAARSRPLAVHWPGHALESRAAFARVRTRSAGVATLSHGTATRRAAPNDTPIAGSDWDARTRIVGRRHAKAMRRPAEYDGASPATSLVRACFQVRPM